MGCGVGGGEGGGGSGCGRVRRREVGHMAPTWLIGSRRLALFWAATLSSRLARKNKLRKDTEDLLTAQEKAAVASATARVDALAVRQPSR